MSYRVRFTTQTGATGYWEGTFATRAGATHSAQSRVDITGYTYTVEEVPEPGSTAEHHVEILRARVKELEALVEERGRAVTDAHVANHAMHRDLALALQIGDAMREAMRTGEWRAGHDRSMASSAIAGWDRWKTSLGKAPSVPVGASEAPGEGGDIDQRRLEALERYLEGHTWRRIRQVNGYGMVAESHDPGIELAAPTLAALADKLAEREAKP